METGSNSLAAHAFLTGSPCVTRRTRSKPIRQVVDHFLFGGDEFVPLDQRLANDGGNYAKQ